MPRQTFKIAVPLILFTMAFYLILLPFIQYPLTTLFKPIPIFLLILFTIQVNLKRLEKFLLLCALSCSLFGDIILTLPIKAAIQIGIVTFMVTHCTYICLFLRNMQFEWKRFAFFLPVLALVIVGFYLLWPYLGEMNKPVTVYIFLLTLMVFFSFQVKQHALLIGVGALLFLLSDFVLALTLFVLPNNKPTTMLIMLFYYTAQFLLVMGVTQTKLNLLCYHNSITKLRKSLKCVNCCL
ncbi:MAG: lysoplasmalogenase [Legionella longbeachae]|nr:lysoplasmalogenase [Legionella longbeachae]